MPKYHVGQRVRIKQGIDCTPGYERFYGDVFHVKALPGAFPSAPEYYALDVEVSPGRHLGAIESALEPVYDGDTPSTWHEFQRVCGFHPGRVAAL